MSIQEDIKDHLVNGCPTFTTEQWTAFTNKYEKEEIKVAFIEYLRDNDVPFPIPEITENEVTKLFKRCQKESNELMFVEGYSKFNYDREFDDIVFDGKPDYNKISGYFQNFNRHSCHTKKYPAPIECWNTGNRMREIVKYFWNFKVDSINRTTWMQAFQVGGQIASQFRVDTARKFYNVFKANKVLDMSSGWGDRLAGFYCSNAEHYIGIDPSTNVYNMYKEQIDFYNRICPKKTTLFNLPAEDVDYSNIKDVDLAFTSPPYFSAERYSDEETQSWKRYKTIDEWKYDFLFPVLEKAYSTLRTGGHLVVNISDVLIQKKRVNFCDEMIKHVLNLDDAVFVGYYGMKLVHRPNMTLEEGIDKKGIYVEPVWVFRKGGDALSLNKREEISDLFE